MIRLIAFDLDGTLLNQEKKVDPVTKDALNRLAEQGVFLIPATGRTYGGCRGVLEGLQGIPYVITCNGAGIYDWQTKQCVYRDCMELEDYLPLLAELDQLSLMADSFVDGGAYMNAAKKPMIERLNVNQETKDYIYSSRTIVKDQVATLKERGIPVEKLTVNFMEDEKGQRIDYEQAWEILRKYPAFNPVSGGMKNIEVTKRGVSKKTGLAWVGKQLGVSPEEMMALGDSGNDVDMLRYAGLGIAMGNAEEMAVEAADETTGSNTENGIAMALKKHEREIINGKRHEDI